MMLVKLLTVISIFLAVTYVFNKIASLVISKKLLKETLDINEALKRSIGKSNDIRSIREITLQKITDNTLDLDHLNDIRSGVLPKKHHAN